MIRAILRRLFGRPATVVELRQRADLLRDHSFNLLARAKVARDEAKRLDAAADEIEFGPLARFPPVFPQPRSGEGDDRNARPPNG